jgi:hypothetical protein
MVENKWSALVDDFRTLQGSDTSFRVFAATAG